MRRSGDTTMKVKFHLYNSECENKREFEGKAYSKEPLKIQFKVKMA